MSLSTFAEADFGGNCRGAGNCRCAGYASSVFGVLTAHKMPGPGATALDLTGSGNLDSLFQPLVGLLFRHSTTSLKEFINGVLYAICRPRSTSYRRFGQKFRKILFAALPDNVQVHLPLLMTEKNRLGPQVLFAAHNAVLCA